MTATRRLIGAFLLALALFLGVFFFLHRLLGIGAGISAAVAFIIAFVAGYLLGRRGEPMVVAAGIGFAAIAPLYFPTVEVGQIVVYAIIALGLNLVTGYTGQLSLAHSAMVALGAYTTGILYADYGWPFLATIPVAAILTMLAGLFVGVIALRFSEVYLAITTTALAIIMPILLKHFDDLTGGAQGKLVSAPTPPSWLGSLTSDRYVYYLSAVIAVILFVLAWNIVRGAPGRAFRAVRDDDAAATVIGVSLTRYKVTAFVLGSLYAGVGGALTAVLIGYLSPDVFGLFYSIDILLMIVIGGLGTILGSVVGAAVVWESTLNIQEGIPLPLTSAAIPPQAVFGALVIITMLLVPNGIVGSLRGLPERGWFRRLGRQPSAGPAAGLVVEERPIEES